MQVATTLATKDTAAAQSAMSMLQQENVVNENLRAQGLPEGRVLAVSSQVISFDYY